MIKIAIIVSDDDFSFMAGSILAKVNHPNITHEIVNTYGTNIDSVHLNNPDIILARGLTARALREKYPSVTIIEMPTSAQDILYAVSSARKIHSARKILILGTESMSLDVDMLRDIVAVEMRLKTISVEEEIVNALEAARPEGFDAVVGGFTACRKARDLGWDCAYIRTSDDTFRRAVDEAMKTATIMFTERARAEIYRSILDSANEGIVYFDSNNSLITSNRRAREMLGLPADALPDACRAESLLGDGEAASLLQSPQERRDVLCHVNKAMLVANATPVMLDDQNIGTVCTFRPAQEIQAAETMIRRAINKKGLTARYRFSDIVHASAGMTELLSMANKYARADANILLVGETGTGKELFAQSIHHASGRSQQPFVPINCAAFPDTLLDSELFGYAEGAFSGAARGGKTGLFEIAHGGTMFLDEVGEIPLNLQPKLLRALQEREIRKIGDDRVIPVDVRIIAATNIDLWARAEAGLFRMDLLHRLDVLSLRIPALRERPDDIRPIAEGYFRAYRGQHDGARLRLDESAWAVLLRYEWPGNARELRNMCERLSIVYDKNGIITSEMVRRILRTAKSTHSVSENETPIAGMRSKPKSVDELVRLADSMRLTRSEIASMLGISRATLFRWLKNKETDTN